MDRMAEREGISVRSAMALDNFEERRAALPESVTPRAWDTIDSATSRKELCRWRAHFEMQPTDIVFLEELWSDSGRSCVSDNIVTDAILRGPTSASIPPTFLIPTRRHF